MRITIFLLCVLIINQLFSQNIITDERTGVKIIFSAEGEIFPQSWCNDKINAHGVSLNLSEYTRSEKIVKKALEKYPISLIKRHLSKVYVLDNINFYGQNYGGTNSTNVVYLSNKGIDAGYSDFYLEQLFHAEFSSILLRNNKSLFDENKWITNNPLDFKYGKGGVNALKSGEDSERFDDFYNRMGFINQYAKSSMENDFNSYAKNIFLPKPGFSELIKKYPSINNKRELIIKFYNQLNKSFTKEFFDKILEESSK